MPRAAPVLEPQSLTPADADANILPSGELLVVFGTGDLLADAGFAKVFDLSVGTFIVLQRADTSVVGYSGEGSASCVVGMVINGETGLGIRTVVPSKTCEPPCFFLSCCLRGSVL